MEAYLKSKGSHLKETSILAYCSALKWLFLKLDYKGTIEDFQPKDYLPIVLKVVSDDFNLRAKQILSALILCFPEDDQWKTLLKARQAKEKEWDLRQELTTNQKAAWMDWSDIVNVREGLANRTAPLWTKLNLSREEYNLLQDYVIASVYTHIPPRRLLDYCVMRRGEPENESENGIVSRDDGTHYFVFNVYKTAKHYGPQTVGIPDILWNILREWMKINTNYWMFTINDHKFTVDQLSRKIGRIFGRKGLGVNILRHSFVTDEVLPSTPFLSELNNVAKDLGHSYAQTMLYKKHK